MVDSTQVAMTQFSVKAGIAGLPAAGDILLG